MLFPCRIYFARGLWNLGEFGDIFPLNISEDQNKSYYLSVRPWHCTIWEIQRWLVHYVHKKFRWEPEVATFREKTLNWNDRRSRRVFLCFYSAIFQLTSAKFQTFAYNSRTVRSSCKKFLQQFEINELYVCTKFRDNKSRDFGFRTRKPPRKLGVKSGLSQKRLKYGKKYFIWLYVSRYPSSQPTHFWLQWCLFLFFSFFSFFFLFFLPDFCTLFFS